MLGDVGGWVGGLAAAGAALYAARKYAEWRAQKDSRVAGAFLVQLVKTCNALEAWVRNLEVIDEGQYLASAGATGWQPYQVFLYERVPMGVLVRDLESTAVEAAIHLPDMTDPEGLAAETARLYRDLMDQVEEWHAHPGTIRVNMERSSNAAGQYTAEIRAIRERGVRTLRPYARGEKA